MNISIIGGAGFVGTRLSKNLEELNIKHNIYDINTKSDFHIYADVTQVNTLDAIKYSDTIINLAAVHRDDIKPLSLYDDVNVGGAENICIAARKYNINKIIFTSSVAIYGFAPKNTNENGKPNYFNDYGRTKYLAEKVYIKWYEEDPVNRSLIIIRPTVIFGEGNRGNVYNLLKQIASKKFVMMGNGSNIKSMAYVENVSSFINYSLSFPIGIHRYNYIDKPDLNMNQLISLVRKILFSKNNVGIRLPAFIGYISGYIFDFISIIVNKNLPISSIRIKKFLSDSQFDTSIKRTGFKPSVTLEEGMIKTLTYEFIEDNKTKEVFKTE
ncbi:NAD-dependent epimerase/dehydratase family protein [Gammaproteobacteria bacterium]|nr:NAD-dependent epimerase/dehydratase family protein [Gammaproteobacteria bacterium]